MAELYFGPDDDQSAVIRELLDLADDPRDVNYQVGYGKPHVLLPDELAEKYHATQAPAKRAPRKRAAGAKKAETETPSEDADA